MSKKKSSKSSIDHEHKFCMNNQVSLLGFFYFITNYWFCYSPPLSYNATMDLYNEVYAANTTLSFTAIVTDHGSPVRGATATFTFLVDNSCLVDVEYGLIPYSVLIGNETGDIYFRVPGYYYYEYGNFYYSVVAYMFYNKYHSIIYRDCYSHVCIW